MRWVREFALVANPCKEAYKCLFGVLLVKGPPLRVAVAAKAVAHRVGLSLQKGLSILASACEVRCRHGKCACLVPLGCPLCRAGRQGQRRQHHATEDRVWRDHGRQLCPKGTKGYVVRLPWHRKLQAPLYLRKVVQLKGPVVFRSLERLRRGERRKPKLLIP